jgi:hypothetical protein
MTAKKSMRIIIRRLEAGSPPCFSSSFFCALSLDATALKKTPRPVPIISPIPRLDLKTSASAMEANRPWEMPTGVRM